MNEQRLKSLDLSKHMITHMNRELTLEAEDVEVINLDQNSISKLENISHLHNLQQLSAGHNCLIKISGIEQLRNLTVLNLPENSICSIEGIHNLNQLVWLNLSGNNIRHITGLKNNIALKHLDLSDNTITSLADLSHLFALKALLLHGNIIRDLREAPKWLPKNLNILSLAENEITELSQVRNLTQLKKLTQFSLMNNPCVTYQQLTHHSDSYRAYILSWICTLEVLDATHITATERQHANHLLESGTAHRFAAGDQGKLINYLTNVDFSSSSTPQTKTSLGGDGGRPRTAGGREKQATPQSSGVRKTKSDDKISSQTTKQQRDSQSGTQAIHHHITATGPQSTAKQPPSPAKSKSRHSSAHSVVSTAGDTPQSTGSPLVSRRDMQGLIRQVIGQERSPSGGGTTRPTPAAAPPKQSTALPKMSRSRSASRSPSREKRTPASRKLILVSSNEHTDHSGVYTTDSDSPYQKPVAPTSQSKKKSPSKTSAKRPPSPSKPSIAYTSTHQRAAIRIQTLWRGYSTRNLDPKVTKVKQELRCRRLEETLAFVVSEMNRQQTINTEGQKVRSSMIAGIETLAQKLEELQHSRVMYTDPSAV